MFSVVQKSNHGEHNELHKVHKELKKVESKVLGCGQEPEKPDRKHSNPRLLRQENFVPLNDFGPRNDVSTSTQNPRGKD